MYLYVCMYIGITTHPFLFDNKKFVLLDASFVPNRGRRVHSQSILSCRCTGLIVMVRQRPASSQKEFDIAKERAVAFRRGRITGQKNKA